MSPSESESRPGTPSKITPPMMHGLEESSGKNRWLCESIYGGQLAALYPLYAAESDLLALPSFPLLQETI
jgi:hypothetical protein